MSKNLSKAEFVERFAVHMEKIGHFDKNFCVETAGICFDYWEGVWTPEEMCEEELSNWD